MKRSNKGDSAPGKKLKQASIKDMFKPKPTKLDWIETIKENSHDWINVKLGGTILIFPFQPYNSQKALMSKMLQAIKNEQNAVCLIFLS